MRAIPIGVLTPGLPEFREFAKARRVIPVVRRLLVDGDTAVGELGRAGQACDASSDDRYDR